MNYYRWHKNVVLRLANFPTEFSDLSSPFFKEALYLASTSLFNTTQGADRTLPDGENSLLKYLLRSRYRSTPFGLFASIGTGQWASQTTIQADVIERHTQLDTSYLYGLVHYLVTHLEAQQHLSFYTNNSLYEVSNDLRYVEYTMHEGRRRYTIASVEANEVLVALLRYCEVSKAYPDICQFLVSQGYPFNDSRSYLDALIQRQLLVSTLSPPVIGLPPLQHIIRKLSLVDHKIFNTVRQRLEKVTNLLNEVDDLQHQSLTPTTYSDIASTLNKIGAPVEESKLFHTVSTRRFANSDIADTYQKSLTQAVNVLNCLTPSQESAQLISFKKRYVERYGTSAQPLLPVLDTESGISYPSNMGKGYSSLLNKLSFPLSANDLSLGSSKKEEYLWNTLQKAIFQQQPVINFSAKEIKKLFSARWDDLPSSVSIMFRLVENDKILIDSINRANGTALVGRFAHADSSVRRLAQDIAEAEQRANPEVIIADIAHLPEDRHGNVVMRPSFYQHTIPYLSNAKAPNQISLQDLYITIIEDRIHLFSKKHQKYVIPRLSADHNFANSDLPVYRFLCDLQTQGMRSNLNFRWSTLDDQFKFLPRAECDSVILYPATWHLTKEDFAVLFASDQKLEQRVLAFQQQWRMPNQLVLADYDRELFVDLTQLWTVEVLLDTIRHQEHIVLQEFFQPSEQITGTKGDRYAHQMVATLIKETATYQAPELPSFAQKTRRNFPPATEWLYYKVYCGTYQADQLIASTIFPLAQELLAEDLISCWFFVRYADPEPHLRIRFHCQKADSINQVVSLVSEHLDISDAIWKIQLDTYQREIERYGGEDSMLLAETIFFHDSTAVAALLLQADTEENRWAVAIRLIHDLLASFNFSLIQRKALMKALNDGFAREFKQGKELKRQIDKLYRSRQSTIDLALAEDASNEVFTKESLSIIQRRYRQLQHLANQIATIDRMNVSRDTLVSSLIHMTCNRVFADAQRKHELVIYDFLFRYYRSLIARNTSVA